MKDKLEVSFYTLLFLLITTLVAGFLISFACFLVFNMKINGGDYIGAIVGSLGNATGGIISAVVAYIVASLQIKKNYELKRKKDLSSTRSKLRMLKVDLEYNLRLIKSNKDDYMQEKRDFIDYISCENWNFNYLYMEDGIISDEVIEKISSIHNKIKLFTSDKFFSNSLYDDFIVSIEDSIKCLEKEISSLSL